MAYYYFPKKTKIDIKETITTTEDTSDWRIYKNNTFGYEIKYPEDWKFAGNDTELDFMAIAGQDYSLIIHVYDKSITEAEKSLPIFTVPGREIDSRTKITISGIEWVKLVVEKNQIIYLTFNNDKTYVAQTSTFEPAQSMSSQILSTFRFIN